MREKAKTRTVKVVDDGAGCGGEAMRSFLADDGEWSEEAKLLLYLASQRGPEARDHSPRGSGRSANDDEARAVYTVASLLLFEGLPTSNAPRQATQHAKYEQYRASAQKTRRTTMFAMTNQPSSRTGEFSKRHFCRHPPTHIRTTAFFLWGFGRRRAEANLQNDGRGTCGRARY